MQLADSLIENTNDFATASTLIFDSIDTQTDKLSHRQLMRHKLLQLKVRNKQDRLTEADTAFSRVADYYRRHGSPNEQVEALYFLARVYHNMGRLPQAIDLYQQADQAADTTRSNCNWKHLFLVHSQLSQLYSDQRMPQREFKELELMEKYAWNSRDTLNALLCKVWQSDCYWALGRYDEAVEQEQKAVHLLTVNTNMKQVFLTAKGILRKDGKLIMPIRVNIICFLDNLILPSFSSGKSCCLTVLETILRVASRG